MTSHGSEKLQGRLKEEGEEIKIKRKLFKNISDMNNGSSYALSSTKRRDTEKAHDLTFSLSSNVLF